MQTDLSGYYALGNDVDASGTAFNPIGFFISPFIGSLDGLGNVISDLVINKNSAGLFGGLFSTNAGIIRNLGVINAFFTGPQNVGTIAVYNKSSINQVYTTGKVIGGRDSDSAGGLVGSNLETGTITNSYSTVTVTGNLNVGGLVGNNKGILSNVFATGFVFGSDNASGLVGNNEGGIFNAYATGSVSTNPATIFIASATGGLVGSNLGTIGQTYATGAVSSDDYGDKAGILVGANIDNGTVNNSYSSGTLFILRVDLNRNLVGSNYSSSSVTNSSAIDSANVNKRSSYDGVRV